MRQAAKFILRTIYVAAVLCMIMSALLLMAAGFLFAVGDGWISALYSIIPPGAPQIVHIIADGLFLPMTATAPLWLLILVAIFWRKRLAAALQVLFEAPDWYFRLEDLIAGFPDRPPAQPRHRHRPPHRQESLDAPERGDG